MLNWCVIFSLVVLTLSCSSNQTEEESSVNDNGELNAWSIDDKTIQGTTQGTTFIIKTSEDKLLVSPEEVSDFLADFDSELSGYIDHSLLSKLNNADSIFELGDNRFFDKCYTLSQAIYTATNGAFDPSVFPLVKAWGFFKDMKKPPSQNEIDSILLFTSFEPGLHHLYEEGVFIKKHPSFQLDFNAIAQGQSADELGQLLQQKGNQNYFIEVGGEIVIKGLNNDNKPWVIGIDEPTEENDGLSSRALENYLSISDKGIATSGNYRKYYEQDGRKFSHTIDPKTGMPVNHNLLSATVIADNAALADGFATAFMTMGVDSTMSFLKHYNLLDIDVYLLFENNQGRIERAFTSGMQKYLLK